ncbi:ATPase [Sulfolobus sp. A20]|uniref:ParA family protein n=1 Tax=Saccharolobus sp. A20 TaxID=1891280 RepID=UPI000846108C|nr:ParA family protein [Sulfolobus sp. A20]TRM74283.1 ParA family protein [Sulfolobus sp. A20-N-F8]TRM77206.1 ParA family protein [Sulfolobus sp. B5]TRM83978.1 ParA family protein [Sulfolobus sp. A20-N-F6]TRM97650.1 ParA family protein [Sulfolobus sp. E1]AOL17163.1 ATPase [Sulfolobus sp. A20]
MKRIDIVSVKGGVGKSFIAYFLTRSLSESKKVLLLDKDLTSTISKIYHIRGSLLSYLTSNSSQEYYKTLGNLTVLNFGCNHNVKSVEPTKIAEIYNVFDENDIIIVDNPPVVSDFCFEKEMESYYIHNSITKKTDYNFITVLPSHQILLDESVAFLKIFLENYLVEFSASHEINDIKTNVLSAVVNMYDRRSKINLSKVYYLTDKIVKLPFIEEAIFSTFDRVKKPKEIDQLTSYILLSLEEM